MIEAAQYIFKIGVADVDDILLNTSGAILGVLFINLVNIKNIYYPVVKYLHTINLGS
jgi:glycopeptide antibiotics resistance protein